MSVPKPTRKIPSSSITEFSSKKKSSSQGENEKVTAYKKRKSNEKKDDKNDNTYTLKQAKFDVFKYGIKGFSKEEQENANMQLAIKLGAAPPKNVAIPYKELLEKKKTEKLKHEALVKEHRQFEAKIATAHSNLSIKKPRKSLNSIRKTKISKGDVGLIKGHIGSFNNGVLKIKKNDLKKINS